MQTTTVTPTLAHLAVPITSLHPHPRNPRRGDLVLAAASSVALKERWGG